MDFDQSRLDLTSSISEQNHNQFDGLTQFFRKQTMHLCLSNWSCGLTKETLVVTPQDLRGQIYEFNCFGILASEQSLGVLRVGMITGLFFIIQFVFM